MRKLITSYFRDESGAAAAEYALILALITVGIAAAAIALGNNIKTAINAAATAV